MGDKGTRHSKMVVYLRDGEETDYSSSLSAKKQADLFIEKQLDLI